MSDKNKLKSFIEFEKTNSDLSGVKSHIWEQLSKDFLDSDNIRGYGVNKRHGFRKIKFFLAVNSVVLNLQKFVELCGVYIGRSVKFFMSRLFSFILFGNFSDCKRYSFKDYSLSSYMKYDLKNSYLSDFNNRQSIYGINFSHHTFKAYTYLRRLKDLNLVKIEKIQNVCEIGAGMLNFGSLLFEESKKLNYVVVDLPEMICMSYSQSEKLLTDVHVFLPNEISKYFACDAPKKLLYILPGQLDSLNESFDFFVNHESFAEMDIDVVNGYLKSVKNKLRHNGYCFLVNRFFRVQAVDCHQFENVSSVKQITQFSDYDLSCFESLVYTVDDFRQYIPRQSKEPNVFYLGRAF